ncbi:MAG: MBL fold metallo-hydrolase [Bacteroidetes bacterium]|nr:MAG: MBL fold metallo-hydrolase [Bacteroidota bacterium]TAG85827.1 MAG: MBL fold metallo-hydrolase [Bacteroidota bacterium]
MSIITQKKFQEVEMIETGFSLFGKPLLNVYCFYVDGLLFDTGQHRMKKHIVKALENKQINKIILTHHHEDHSGNAQTLADLHHAPVYANYLSIPYITQGFPYRIRFYQWYNLGKIKLVKSPLPYPQQFETEKFCFEPIYTPGHCTDHYCFLERKKGWLFSGDLYIGNLQVMRNNDEDMQTMIESITKILEYDFDVLFCCHHPKTTDGKKYLRYKLEYLQEFQQKAIYFYQKGHSIKEIMKKMNKKENWFYKIYTENDIGVDFMVKSALKNIIQTEK